MEDLLAVDHAVRDASRGAAPRRRRGRGARRRALDLRQRRRCARPRSPASAPGDDARRRPTARARRRGAERRRGVRARRDQRAAHEQDGAASVPAPAPSAPTRGRHGHRAIGARRRRQASASRPSAASRRRRRARRASASRARSSRVSPSGREPVEEQRHEQRRRRRTSSSHSAAPQPAAQAATGGHPRGRLQRVAQQQAIVIGPTPPGHRRDRAGDLGAPRRSRRRRRRPSSVRLMPTSMTTAPGLTQSPPTSRGAPDGGDQHVGAPADRGAGRGCASGRSSPSRWRPSSSWAIGLPNEVRAPDDDGLGALERRRRASLEQHHARRSACTGRSPGRPSASRPALTGVSPSTSLPGSMQPGQLVAVEVVGHGQLAEDAVDRRVGVELVDERRRPRSRVASAGQAVVEAAHADLGARLLLVADVDGASRVVADEDGRQARRAAVLGRERRRRRAATSARTRAATALPSMIVALTG